MAGSKYANTFSFRPIQLPQSNRPYHPRQKKQAKSFALSYAQMTPSTSSPLRIAGLAKQQKVRLCAPEIRGRFGLSLIQHLKSHSLGPMADWILLSGILNSLTSSTPNPTPFPRHTIKVYEEPRLREQDFGNFQPSSTEMSRMWQERADYGHFFYRIPNGESAADAYDRVSGFNESLWRSFGEDDFASVCVLVTHGLMTRVFLMKWYHFSVEYFEDLRNINHCEFVVMKLDNGSGKYSLQNQLRTWSEMKRERENSRQEPSSPVPMRKRWVGCQDGVDGDDFARRQRARRQNTAELFGDEADLEQIAEAMQKPNLKGRDPSEDLHETKSAQTDAANVKMEPPVPRKRIISPGRLEVLRAGRDGGGSRSGATSPNRSGSEDSDAEVKERIRSLPVRSSLAMALNGGLDGDGVKHRVRADALGDQSDVEDEEDAKEDAQELKRLEAEDKSFEGSVR